MQTPPTTTRTTTTAAIFLGPDEPLAFEEVSLAPVGAREVVIDIAANGACHSDVHKLQGHGLVAPPCVFGHEISGTVTEIGASVTTLEVGDRVVCSFLVPCGECDACVAGNEDLCSQFRAQMQKQGVRFDGTPRMYRRTGEPLRTSGVGGLARSITMPETAVFTLPPSWPTAIPLEDAAVLGCAGLTAFGAVNRVAHVAPGDPVVVLGAGGVGLCTVAFAAFAGAGHVVVTDMKPDAREAALAFGATSTVAANDDDFAGSISRALGGAEPRLVFDTIGNAHTLRQALAIVGVGGTVVVTGLGGASAPAVIDDLTVFVRRKISLVGSYAAIPSVDMPAMLQAVSAGAFLPADLISARYDFTETERAYADVAAGAVTGRALITYGARD